MTLPIRRIILYKHGVGYFERRGPVSGELLRLSFARQAMDDVLKSLVALDLGAGQVLGIDFETPEDRASLIEKGSIHLSDQHSLLDLLRDLRGRRIRCVLEEPAAPKPARRTFGLNNPNPNPNPHPPHANESANPPPPGTEPPHPPAEDNGHVEGLVIGVDYEEDEPLRRSLVSIYRPDTRRIQTLALPTVKRIELLDTTAAADLDYFLRAAQSEEDRRSATLHLSAGEHDLLVGYIAPAPAWRVSYRMLFEEQTAPGTEHQELSTENQESQFSVLLQGWGLFDNQLEEDLEGVELTLVAGMPISFRYRLYEPQTPERPLVEDEERTVNAPVMFEEAAPVLGGAPPGALRKAAAPAAPPAEAAFATRAFSAADLEESVQAAASGSERGALFAYRVSHPVNVARGQSAMVPILSQRLPCRRDLLYNGQKLPGHPVASLRLTNATGLTLERGPVTVLTDGDYAGEAVVPFTRADGELIVPFAVELGIKVEEQRNSERRITGISVRDEYLLIQEYDLQHTTYHLTSTLTKPVDVVIEHMLLNGYELTDTRDPTEQSASFVRWSVTCEPRARTIFAVHERKLQSRHEQVKSLNGKQLQSYLRKKWLDSATVEALEEVLQLYRQIDEIRQRLQEGANERKAIYQQQTQTRGNLGPLGREGEEGALRKRYVDELNRLEDRLLALSTEEQQLKEQITSLEQQIKTKLAALGGSKG